MIICATPNTDRFIIHSGSELSRQEQPKTLFDLLHKDTISRVLNPDIFPVLVTNMTFVTKVNGSYEYVPHAPQFQDVLYSFLCKALSVSKLPHSLAPSVINFFLSYDYTKQNINFDQFGKLSSELHFSILLSLLHLMPNPHQQPQTQQMLSHSHLLTLLVKFLWNSTPSVVIFLSQMLILHSRIKLPSSSQTYIAPTPAVLADTLTLFFSSHTAHKHRNIIEFIVRSGNGQLGLSDCLLSHIIHNSTHIHNYPVSLSVADAFLSLLVQIDDLVPKAFTEYTRSPASVSLLSSVASEIGYVLTPETYKVEGSSISVLSRLFYETSDRNALFLTDRLLSLVNSVKVEFTIGQEEWKKIPEEMRKDTMLSYLSQNSDELQTVHRFLSSFLDSTSLHLYLRVTGHTRFSGEEDIPDKTKVDGILSRLFRFLVGFVENPFDATTLNGVCLKERVLDIQRFNLKDRSLHNTWLTILPDLPITRTLIFPADTETLFETLRDQAIDNDSVICLSAIAPDSLDCFFSPFTRQCFACHRIEELSDQSQTDSRSSMDLSLDRSDVERFCRMFDDDDSTQKTVREETQRTHHQPDRVQKNAAFPRIDETSRSLLAQLNRGDYNSVELELPNYVRHACDLLESRNNRDEVDQSVAPVIKAIVDLSSQPNLLEIVRKSSEQSKVFTELFLEKPRRTCCARKKAGRH
ncbi:hypothetical protein BLNAU_815 [Blattamonas nauphoetae]|uniref:Uncharacterized protein n=1 Tax=Blattamonas nauphoetae TaxID=2049346 RepID=A0ABQ9YKL0_9EUKA|nr:hypothetical protein BLNAU_815 [Blattamonas nauphoetae]